MRGRADHAPDIASHYPDTGSGSVMNGLIGFALERLLQAEATGLRPR